MSYLRTSGSPPSLARRTGGGRRPAPRSGSKIFKAVSRQHPMSPLNGSSSQESSEAVSSGSSNNGQSSSAHSAGSSKVSGYQAQGSKTYSMSPEDPNVEFLKGLQASRSSSPSLEVRSALKADGWKRGMGDADSIQEAKDDISGLYVAWNKELRDKEYRLMSEKLELQRLVGDTEAKLKDSHLRVSREHEESEKAPEQGIANGGRAEAASHTK